MERPLHTLITGASGGIGRETAIRLSASRKLILHGRDAERVEETRRLCNSPGDHLVWAAELNQVSAIVVALTALIEAQGIAVAGFVHCAGTLAVLPLRSIELPASREMLDVNFFSAVEIVRVLIRQKINERHLASIVFVSSTASQFGARGMSLYCASKGALDAFMRAIAVELAPHTRANSVLPGAIPTAMTAGILGNPETEKRLAAGYPLGRGTAADVASAIEFLLSDAARWVTGQQFVVDGGRTVNISA